MATSRVIGGNTVPDATETTKGIVQLASDGNTAPSLAVQGNDTRLANPIQAQDNLGNQIGTRFTYLREGGDISFNDLGGGVLQITTIDNVGKVAKDQITFFTAFQQFTNPIIPLDGTPPLITEGVQIMSTSYTPVSSSNKITVQVFANLSHSFGGALPVVLFSSLSSNALATGTDHLSNTGVTASMELLYVETISSSAPRTYSVRSGSNAGGILAFNGAYPGGVATAIYGGTLKSYIRITEFRP